jgi:hypothetical protein
MGERSGLSAQLGVALEETYGTYKAATRFFPLESESLSLTKNYVKSKGLRAGRLAQAKNLHRATTRTVGGDVNLEFFDQGMGMLLNLLHGETVTPTKIGATLAYKQLHKIGLSSPYGKSLAVQVGRPDTGGTVRAFSYLGCKVTAAKLSIDANGIAMFTLTLDGQDEVTTETLATPSYSASALPFTFQQMVVKVGAESIGNVRSITINMPIPQSTERFHLGNAGKKDQPIANDFVEVTAETTLEFASLADHARYKNEEVVKLVLVGTGAEIDAENKMKAELTLPAAKQTSSAPQVQGPDIITTSATFEALDNGTEAPLSAELVSTDSAL